MKNKYARMALMLALMLVALAAIAPIASAGMVTKIMYAEESTDYYAYQATTAGTLSVTCGWTNPDGTGRPVYPVAVVNAAIQTGPANDPYADQDVANLYEVATNPNTGTVDLVAGQVAYIAAIPYIGDVPYTVSGTFTGTGVWLGKVDAAGNTTGTTSTKTFSASGTAYAADGEVYPRASGQWFGTAQYWPGKESNSTALTNWNLYVIDRGDYGGWWPEYTYPFTWESETANCWDNNGFTDGSTLADGDMGTKGNQGPINTWYSLTPQEWGGLAVSNIWPSSPADPLFRYGKPGSLTATSAPLWYTYSFSDTAATAPGYFWGTTSTLNASKHNQSSCTATKASFSAEFSGTSITWVYGKSRANGIANVAIDGVSKGTVDQYYNGFQYKQSTTYSGLAAGNHVITITNSATKNPAATNSGISHDAFLAKGYNDASDPTPVLENNYDGMTTYKWGVTLTASASGGSQSSETATKAALAQRFEGTSITWKYGKSRANGIANIYIDGTFKGQVDQYYNGFQYQQTTTFSGLSAGPHIIMITNSATKNPAATNSGITHDAFIVGATTYEN
jgi:hypothetical protein